MLKDLGDFKGARENLERALKIDEVIYGPDHPDVAIDLSNLGSVLKDLGDFQGARTNYERALNILKKVFGDDHPRTRTVQRNLDLLNEENSPA